MASNAVNITNFRTIPGKLSEDRLQWQFPVVKKQARVGREMYWTVVVKCFKMRADIVLPHIPADAFIVISDDMFDARPAPPAEPLPADVFGYIVVRSGFVGGKERVVVPTIVQTGKNLGKNNATNAWTQALRDALSDYNKQVTKSPAGETGGVIDPRLMIPPMTAQVLNPAEITDSTSVFMQIKFNGVRCVTALFPPNVHAKTPSIGTATSTKALSGAAKSVPTGAAIGVGNLPAYNPDTYSLVMYSRGKKIYPGLKYIKDEIEAPLRAFYARGIRLYLDGEIYKHGVSLQEISGQARRVDRVGDTKYNYMIYDCFVPAQPDMIFSERSRLLDQFFTSFQPVYCQTVETLRVVGMDDARMTYEGFLADKYEGAMIRLDAPYVPSTNGYHSNVLLKMKPELDGEYEIVNWETGERGKAANALMIVCKTPKGIIFPVTPKDMTLPERNALAVKMAEIEPNKRTHFDNHWLGRPLIVYYDEISDDGVPLRARTAMKIRTWL